MAKEKTVATLSIRDCRYFKKIPHRGTTLPENQCGNLGKKMRENWPFLPPLTKFTICCESHIYVVQM